MSLDTASSGSKPPVLSRSNLTYHLYRLMNQPEKILGILCLAVLSVFVLGPLFEIIHDALVYQSYDLAYRPEAKVGTFTLFHLERVFTGPLSKALFLKPLFNSVAVGVCVTVLGVGIGSGLAWLMVRTNIRFKGVFGALVVVPYMMPSWVLALAWLSLFKNDRIGGNEGMITSFFGIQPPDWVSYGFFPIVICLALHYYAYGYPADVGRPGNRRFGAGGGGRHRRHEPAPTPMADYVSVAAARVGFRRGAHFHPHSGHLRDTGSAGAAGPVLYLFDPDLRLTERAQQRRRFRSRPGPDRHGDHLHLDQQPGDRHSEELRHPDRQGLPAARNQTRGLAMAGHHRVAAFLAVTVLLPLLILLWESLVITPGSIPLKA